MELTNEQRVCFGLEPIDPSWDRVEIPEVSGMRNTIHPERLLSDRRLVLYFDGDILRKVIWPQKNGGFHENSYRLRTMDGRTKIAPITSKGKAKILNGVNIQRTSPYGVYLVFDVEEDGTAHVRIGNYDTQKTYYSTGRSGLKLPAEVFLDQWIAETTDRDLRDLEVFATEKRRHCKFQEGDFFRFKYDRRHYGYGRVLFDAAKWTKAGNPFWDVLMGKAVCVSIYHIVTEDPDVSISDLEQMKSCPSEYIMDNLLYYGDYEVIGNAPLPKIVDYPIMYGRSISAKDPDKIICCIGKTYREIPLVDRPNPNPAFRNNGIGFEPDIDMVLMEECIRASSNDPIWELQRSKRYHQDLRDPQYHEELERIKKQMGL